MKFVNWIKDILTSIQVLLQDRNFKPFWRPLIIVVLVFVILNILNTSAQEQVVDVKKKIEAQKVEFENEKDYKEAKTKYQNLLSKLPPASQKNEWILLQIESIANLRGLQNDIKYVKGNNATYGILDISTAVITGQLTYKQVGLLVESIENNPQFLRIKNLTLEKQEKAFDKVQVKIEVYTAFLEEHKMLEKTSRSK